MADWYAAAAAGPRDQLMSLHGFDSAAMLGYSPAPFAGLQPHEAYPHPHPHPHAHSHVQAAQHAAAAAYSLQRQQQPNFCFSDQQWRHPDGSIMELRKEKSRDAARSRRGKENFEFYELAKMLPLPHAITTQLDKASVIRLTLSYLKLRDFTLHGDPPWGRINTTNKNFKNLRGRSPTCPPLHMELFDVHQGTHILQSLDGFAFTLAADGRFLYISETVSIYLGLSQVEMAGSSVFEYVHVDDHQELADQLELTLATGQPAPSPSSLGSDEANPSDQGTMNPDVATSMTVDGNSNYTGYDRAFCIRMKSTLTKRGCHFKSSGYRVVLIMGHLRPQYIFSHTPRKSPPALLGMVGLAIAMPPPSVHELRLESDMFVTRLNFDFRIAHCEPKVSDLLDYTAEELQGRSLYSLCHGQDATLLRKAHTDLLKKGQVMTPYYRLLSKSGGYSCMQLCATIICNTKTGEEQSIIAVNYVLRTEARGTVLDCSQLPHKDGAEAASDEKHACDSLDSERAEFDGRSNSNPHSDYEVMVHQNSQAYPKGTGGSVENVKEASTLDAVNNNNQHSVPTNPPTPSTTASPPPETPPTPNSVLSSTLHSPDKNKSPPAIVSPSPCSSMPNSNFSPIRCRTQLSPQNHNNNTSFTSLEKISHHDLSGGGSVRHLEAAMTRHLPQESGLANGLANGLGGGLSGGLSTIQWAGGQEPSSSAILRQLYAAKRETVIRTSRDTGETTSPPSSTTSSIPPSPLATIQSTAPGILPHNTSFAGYHLTPPASMSPERLKGHACDPYSDLYPPLYASQAGPPKNPYDALRSPWYTS